LPECGTRLNEPSILYSERLDRAKLGVISVKVTKEAAMSAAIINLYKAKTSLSRLVERAVAGEEIIIAKAGKPKARLVRLAGKVEARQPGGWEGKVWVAGDFDEPLPADILAGFEGKD
jgi:prevent-host-death family protein